MKNKNFYEILNLNPDATKDEIKNSFRKLVRLYHPDVNHTKEAEVYFKLLNNAVETLLDDIKRKSYDTAIGIVHSKKTQEKENYKKSSNVDDEYSKQVNETFDYSEYSSGKEQNSAEKSYKGKDITTTVQITKSEASKGTTRKINILHTEKCPKCLGRKFINGSKCSLCKGEGESSIHKKVNVKIPPYVKDGTKIKLEGMGEPGKFDEPNGDLYLLIQIKADTNQRFEGKDIITEVSITPYEAVLGTTLKIPVEGQDISLTVPPLTKSMTRFKLMTDNGFDKTAKTASFMNNLRSSYVVVVKIDIPDNLSKEEIDVYKKLKALEEEKTLRKSGEIF